MDKKLERILPLVQKPARYTGGEYGEIQKDKSEVDLRMALCFPDTYEIGMSNTGMRILYQVLNDLPGVWCERVFAPWFDMDRQMREKGLPLYALESGDPLSEFDAIGFSLGYEMAYTTVLEMLDLAGIPLRSAERTSLTPLVFAGGSVCCNSEPMADFFDLMIIGEGESVDGEVLQLLREAKATGWSKAEFLRRAALIGGVYVPSLYTPEYNGDGTLKAMHAAPGAPERITKRIVTDFENTFGASSKGLTVTHDGSGLFSEKAQSDVVTVAVAAGAAGTSGNFSASGSVIVSDVTQTAQASAEDLTLTAGAMKDDAVRAVLAAQTNAKTVNVAGNVSVQVSAGGGGLGAAVVVAEVENNALTTLKKSTISSFKDASAEDGSTVPGALGLLAENNSEIWTAPAAATVSSNAALGASVAVNRAVGNAQIDVDAVTLDGL